MKTSILIAAVLGLTTTIPPALAQAVKPAGSASQVQLQVLSPADFDKRLAQAQEHMRQMQAQMDKIAATQDPQERQRLLQEHGASMQAAMSAMHGMWGPGGADKSGMGPGMMMGGPMMGWDRMRGYYSSLTPEQLKQRQYMIDQYMPMQQMMMDHMMWHQRWMSPQPPAVTK